LFLFGVFGKGFLFPQSGASEARPKIFGGGSFFVARDKKSPPQKIFRVPFIILIAGKNNENLCKKSIHQSIRIWRLYWVFD
jgi:hypothetical protein